jgi:choice-of-anchor C domain-containing protein
VKRRAGLGVALGVFASIAFAQGTLAFTGLTDGSFDDNGAYIDNGSGFQQLDAPNTSIPGWTVGGHSVDWISTYWPAQDGAMSIDLSGSNAGSLSQILDTTIGNTYTVSFALSGNPAGPPSLKTLEVSATGGTTGLYSYDVTANANDLTDMKWTTETYSFLATSVSTTLTFLSTTEGAYGPALDNVVVTESIPEKDDCKDGGWQSMIDNAGNSFKNQGDCVSYFATKGKNLGAVPPAVATDAGASVADSTTRSVRHSEKQVTKASTKTERQVGKATGKSQAEQAKTNGHGHKPGSKKNK